MITNNYEFEIHAPWMVGEDEEYMDEIFDIIFAEENIIPEEDFTSEEDMIEAIIKGFEMEFDELTNEEFYNKYYGEK